MRNYIHIMLCCNLFIAQLLFVVGIQQTRYQVHLSLLFLYQLLISLSIFTQSVCSAIAVILQYMFLVSFMWMLMEGVVLYVALVRVFIKHSKRYIIAFTLFSYGI